MLSKTLKSFFFPSHKKFPFIKKMGMNKSKLKHLLSQRSKLCFKSWPLKNDCPGLHFDDAWYIHETSSLSHLFSSLLAEMRSILHENMGYIHHQNENSMIKHAETYDYSQQETNAVTGNGNLVKHSRAKMLSFNFLVKVPLPPIIILKMQ